MNNPAGLRRYARSMRTKYSGTCTFCGTPTVPGNDYAAQTGSQWVAVCIPCAESTVAQVRGTYKRILTAVRADDVTAEMKAAAGAAMPDRDTIDAAMTDGAPDALAFDTLVRLLAVFPLLTPVDPIQAGLQAVADNAQASAYHRTTAASLIENMSKWGKLTDKQRSFAQSIIDEYSGTGTPKPAGLELVEGGIYDVLGTLYLIEKSKKGYLYAMVLASEPVADRKLDWQFAKGALPTVRRSGRAITADEAAALGHTTSRCCFCGIKLEDDGKGRSVEVGYGPVCASKHGLPWG